MEKQDAAGIITSLTRERDEVTAEVERMQQRVRSLEQVLDGLYGLFPDLQSEPSPAAQSPATMTMGQAFMAVLSDLPDAWLSISELLDIVGTRGIGPDSAEPEAAGRAALKPLRRDGKVVRRRRSGRAYEYRLMSPQAALEVPSEELFNAPDDDESPA